MAFLPAVAWAAVLLMLGRATGLPGPETALPLDKVAHFVAYALLGVLGARGWERAGRWPRRLWLLLALAAVGAVDEWSQRTVPGRTADVGDWVADVAGILAGFAAATWWWSERRRRSHR